MIKRGEGTHGHSAREYNIPPTGVTFQAGRFGRMVPELTTPFDPPDEHLVELGLAMVDDATAPASSGNNDSIPAGFTYLGQFVDHDITLDTTTLTEVAQDPAAIENFRTPRLDLDSVYGLGPRVQPSLYDRNSPGRAKLLIGATVTGGGDPNIKPGLPHDLPRNSQGFAIIGDERNDENLLVAQTHLAFMRFHNAMVDRLTGTVPDSALFKEARRAVVDLYQAILIRDFLAKICDPAVIEAAIDKRRFFRFEEFGKFGQPYMPVEFSVAAYRLGHTMVREVYSHNRVFRPGGPGPGTFNFFFRFTAKSGIIGTPDGPSAFPSDWVIDWRRFFDFNTTDETDGFRLNPTRTIDPYLAPALHRLPAALGDEAGSGEPSAERSLAVMNLRRGVKMKLPAAQDLAQFMGVDVLPPEEIAASGADGAVAAKHGLHERTPLWYYILKEAQIQQQGQRLGTLGSLIVAVTFIGMMQGDPESILSRDPTWRFGQPIKGLVLPGADENFTFADLLRIAAGVPDGADEATMKKLLSPIDDPDNLIAQPVPQPAEAGPAEAIS
jgi:hypothetical protein